jgi:small-conductance mechanosensitive channel
MTDIAHVASLTLFAIGRTPVTLGGVVAGFAVAALFFLAARFAGFGIGRLSTHARQAASALYIVRKLVTYGLVIVGVVAGLSTMGLDLSSLAVFAGAVGVGVGLGLQGIVKEFVSGLVLIFDRVMGVGDFVELEGGKRGLVQEIGPRSVRVRTNDDVDLAIPNSKFIEGPVVNWTLHGQGRRIHIPFGVAYGSDRRKVREVVLAAARKVPFTLPESEAHKTQVWLIGFGESSLQFELLVWPTIEAVKRPAAMQAAYTWAIADALEAAGIEIPNPQRDLHIRSLFGHRGDAALEALNLKSPAPAAPTPAGVPAEEADNDAAEDLARPLPEPPARAPDDSKA